MLQKTNNWAVIVSTSRFFSNYRHTSNALSVYKILRGFGFPDNRILLMIAEDISTHPNNPIFGSVYNNPDRWENICDRDVQIDYKDSLVSTKTFFNLLANIPDINIPETLALRTDSNSNIFIYISGHGGTEFFMFQGLQDCTNLDFAAVFDKMHTDIRYKSMVLILETCQASTLISNITAPNIIAISSSTFDYSYSYYYDLEIGTPLIDRFTYHLYEFSREINEFTTIQDFIDTWSISSLSSTPYIISTSTTPYDKIKLVDYFAVNSFVLYTKSIQNPLILIIQAFFLLYVVNKTIFGRI